MSKALPDDNIAYLWEHPNYYLKPSDVSCINLQTTEAHKRRTIDYVLAKLGKRFSKPQNASRINRIADRSVRFSQVNAIGDLKRNYFSTLPLKSKLSNSYSEISSLTPHTNLNEISYLTTNNIIGEYIAGKPKITVMSNVAGQSQSIQSEKPIQSEKIDNHKSTSKMKSNRRGDGTSVSQKPSSAKFDRLDSKKDKNSKSDNSFVSPTMKISFVGKGLVEAFCGIPNKFMIIVKTASRKKRGPKNQLSIAIEGPSKANITLKNIHKGFTLVRYIVEKPGFYACLVKMNKVDVKSSPFVLNIKPRDCQLDMEGLVTWESINVDMQPEENNQIKTIITFIPDDEYQLHATVHLKAYVKFPSGIERSVTCIYNHRTNVMSSEFLSNEIGRHLLAVVDKKTCPLIKSNELAPLTNTNSYSNGPLTTTFLNESLIFYNPYPIWIKEHNYEMKPLKEVKKVSTFVHGTGICYGYVDLINSFLLEMSSPDNGNNVKVDIEGPSKAEINYRKTKFGYHITYRPFIAGVYSMKVTENDEEIMASPFLIRIFKNPEESEHSTVVDNRVLCYGKALMESFINQWNDFYVQIVHNPLECQEVVINGTTEICAKTNMRQLKNGVYSISFCPEEPGKHTVLFKFKDNLQESPPFYINVFN